MHGIPDTAATNHYIDNKTLDVCHNIISTDRPKVAVANGEIMTPKAKAILPVAKQLTTKTKRRLCLIQSKVEH